MYGLFVIAVIFAAFATTLYGIGWIMAAVDPLFDVQLTLDVYSEDFSEWERELSDISLS